MNIQKLSSPAIFRSSIKRITHMLLLLATVFLAAGLARADDTFVQVLDENGTPIKSENQDKNFKGEDGWFDIYDFDLGVSNTVAIDDIKGGATGKSSAGPIKFTKHLDKSSPQLFKAAAAGTKLKKLTMVCRKSSSAGSTTDPYLTFTLSDVYVTKVEWSGGTDDAPSETVTFVYGKFEISYTPLSTTGKPEDPIEAMWDFVNNKAN